MNKKLEGMVFVYVFLGGVGALACLVVAGLPSSRYGDWGDNGVSVAWIAIGIGSVLSSLLVYYFGMTLSAILEEVKSLKSKTNKDSAPLPEEESVWKLEKTKDSPDGANMETPGVSQINIPDKQVIDFYKQLKKDTETDPSLLQVEEFSLSEEEKERIYRKEHRDLNMEKIKTFVQGTLVDLAAAFAHQYQLPRHAEKLIRVALNKGLNSSMGFEAARLWLTIKE